MEMTWLGIREPLAKAAACEGQQWLGARCSAHQGAPNCFAGDWGSLLKALLWP